MGGGDVKSWCYRPGSTVHYNPYTVYCMYNSYPTYALRWRGGPASGGAATGWARAGSRTILVFLSNTREGKGLILPHALHYIISFNALTDRGSKWTEE